MKPGFTHLRVHSEYSIVDGLVRLEELVESAASDNQPALALTDLSNLFGMVKFYKLARSRGIKPIIGCDIYVADRENFGSPTRLLVFARDRSGYLELCNLLSRAWLENEHKGKAVVCVDWLREAAQKGNESSLIALSGASLGDVGLALLAGDQDAAESKAAAWRGIFGNNYYIEVQRSGNPHDESLVASSVELARTLNIPVVATHAVQFMRPEEFRAHEARTCISEGQTLANPKRVRRFNVQQSFKTQDEMIELFADIPQAIANSLAIAQRCNLIMELGKPKLPNFPVPAGLTIDEFLHAESVNGLEARLLQLYPDDNERLTQRPRYEARLKFEIDTICNMKFPGYFLIVAEFIKWAKENGIPVGPGRGSGAGSLVAYSLLITDLDPLAYNLLFERFLNPDRVSMPDFDIDFCQEGRDRVIQHVKDLYGKEAVSQIVTFGTMAAKGAIRDVGRVLDLGYNFCDGISKLIPFKPGKHVTIASAIEEEPVLAERKKAEEEVNQLLTLAQQVEGITRNIGMHAGGVLIAPGKLTDFCPLYTQAGDTGVISQFDKDDVESVGLVKFDFLGLTTLTVIDRAVRYIRALDPELSEFRIESIPLTDKPSYELLAAAKTVAVFQLESRGMQGMLKEAKPDRFEDIIALVALYRPGPMDLIPEFCRRKHGEGFSYPDPRTEGILSETYGIMVYQEQVMQMAQVVGGYSLGGADLLRRAMGKKKVEEMAEHRQLFQAGAAKGGLSNEKADEIFDLMEKFAGYGFNKSHAAAYALLSYQTAFLKTHHAAAFIAANMSLAMEDTDKIKILYDDAIEVCGLTFLPPDINQSDCFFIPKRGKGGAVDAIQYGLGAIKGAGHAAMNAIVAARSDGKFTSIFDLAKRVDKQFLNRRALEALIRAGALDSFNVERASLLATVSVALDGAQQAKASSQQVSLFDEAESEYQSPNYVSADPWSYRTKLVEEKTVLGFFLSGHPFEPFSKEAHKFSKTRISELKANKDTSIVAGMVSAIRTNMSARGKIYTITIDDGTGALDVTVYNEVFDTYKKVARVDEFVTVIGKLSPDRFNGGVRLTAEKLLDISSARAAFSNRIDFDLPASVGAAAVVDILRPFCTKRGLRVVISRQNDSISYKVALPKTLRVEPSDEFNAAVVQVLGAKNLEYIY